MYSHVWRWRLFSPHTKTNLVLSCSASYVWTNHHTIVDKEMRRNWSVLFAPYDTGPPASTYSRIALIMGSRAPKASVLMRVMLALKSGLAHHALSACVSFPSPSNAEPISLARRTSTSLTSKSDLRATSRISVVSKTEAE